MGGQRSTGKPGRNTAGTDGKLLAAALQVFSACGYAGASTRAIAAEAGVAEVTLFRRFGSKQRLFEAMLEAYTFLPRLRSLLPELEGLDAGPALQEVGVRFLATLSERESLARVMLREVTGPSGAVRALYLHLVEDTVALLAGFLKKRQRRGELRAVPPVSTARTFLGALFSYFLTEAVVKGRVPPPGVRRRYVGEVIDLMISGAGR